MKKPRTDIEDIWYNFVNLGMITKDYGKPFKKSFTSKRWWRLVQITWANNGLWTSLNVHGTLSETYFSFSKISFLTEDGRVLTGKMLILGKLLVEYGSIKLK